MSGPMSGAGQSTPVDYSQYVCKPEDEGGMSFAPTPAEPPKMTPVAPPKPADKATYSAAPKAEPNMSFVEEPVCKAPEPAAPPPPPKPAIDPAKLEKKAEIWKSTITDWEENHKTYKSGDGAAMWLMDKAFGSGANAVYAQQEKELRGMYDQYKSYMAKGDYENASKQLDYIIHTAIPKYESLATKARDGAISNAEAAAKGAEVVRDVSFGVVAGGAILATGGAAAPAVFGAGGGGLLGTAAVGTAITLPGMVVLEGGADAAGAALTGGDAGAAFVGGAKRGAKDTAIAGVAVVATGGLAGVMAHSGKSGVAAAGHLMHSGEHAVVHMTTTQMTKGAAVEVGTYVGTEVAIKKTGVAVAKKVAE